MDVRTAMTALPWARRAWRALPPPLRIPVLVVAVGVGVWYVVAGREQLRQASEAGQEPPISPQPR